MRPLHVVDEAAEALEAAEQGRPVSSEGVEALRLAVSIAMLVTFCGGPGHEKELERLRQKWRGET